jgi:uncharacterized membrane protein YtjA (UPF0391 family)
MRTRHGCSRFATDRFDGRFVSQPHLASRWVGSEWNHRDRRPFIRWGGPVGFDMASPLVAASRGIADAAFKIAKIAFCVTLLLFLIAALSGVSRRHDAYR